jgi:hypothetical protein
MLQGAGGVFAAFGTEKQEHLGFCVCDCFALVLVLVFGCAGL